jgi:hypothetical protein
MMILDRMNGKVHLESASDTQQIPVSNSTTKHWMKGRSGKTSATNSAAQKETSTSGCRERGETWKMK